MDYSKVESLAYKFWEDRGCPFGTPEEDWFRAEAQLMQQPEEPAASLLDVAKSIGSALGSIASLINPLKT